jgi:hypothetical protein
MAIDRVWLLDNMELIQLIGRADRELGRLDMYYDYIPNLDRQLTLESWVGKELDRPRVLEMSMF